MIWQWMAAIVLLVCAASADAADQFDYSVASIIILQAKPVQADLGVSAAQRDSMNKFADSHQAALKSYYTQVQKSGKTPDRTKLEKMFSELKAGVLSQLSAAQLRRLREISLQEMGFSALADSTVAAKVGIQSAELKKVRDVIRAGLNEANKTEYDAINAATKNLQAMKPKTEAEKKQILAKIDKAAAAADQSVKPRIERIRADTESKVMALLTPAQKSNWKALLGRPFRGG